jgi:glycosyltransferase involved in cell wall biosynthesis
VVVASVFPYFPVLSTRLAALGTDTPLITTWHEVWGEYWEEYLGPLAVFGKVSEHVTARTPQHPIAISGITADRLAEIGPCRDDVAVVPNGIDTGQIRTAPCLDEGYDVLFAGRLIEYKNVDLLKAFDQVSADRDISLGIIGDGSEKKRLESQWESLARPDGVTSQVPRNAAESHRLQTSPERPVPVKSASMYRNYKASNFIIYHHILM